MPKHVVIHLTLYSIINFVVFDLYTLYNIVCDTCEVQAMYV